MAGSKTITQLPLSTTPLNGTEELPIYQNGHTYKTLTGNIVSQATSGATLNPNVVHYLNTYSEIGTEPIGSTYWDSSNHTLTTVLENGVKLQNGQEVHIYVLNQSGTNILNGDAVSIVSNVNYQSPTVALTNLSTNAYDFVGLATQDIPTGSYGYITFFGLVHQLNTQAFTEGDELFVSHLNPGKLINYAPPSPYARIKAGIVVKKNPTDGEVLVVRGIVHRLQDLPDIDGVPLTTTGQILVWNQAGKYFDAGYNINNYSTTAHNHDGRYEPIITNPTSSGLLLTSDMSGNKSWVSVSTSGLVPNTRKINNKPLSADISLNSSDIGSEVYLGLPSSGNKILSSDSSGNRSWIDPPVTMTPATSAKLGGIIVGDNLNVDINGRLSAIGGTANNVTFASTPTLTATNVQNVIVELDDLKVTGINVHKITSASAAPSNPNVGELWIDENSVPTNIYQIRLEKRYDLVASNSYCGTAPYGTSESVNLWTIYKISINNMGVVIRQVATNVAWINRLTINYN